MTFIRDFDKEGYGGGGVADQEDGKGTFHVNPLQFDNVVLLDAVLIELYSPLH
jgi:hypothetical protein